MPDFTICL